jgi:hypothetical protein
VQHDVIDHVAFVFGVIETERAAEVFGALLRNGRMPSFHMHSKSRSATEGGGGGHECDKTFIHVSLANRPITGVQVLLSCTRTPKLKLFVMSADHEFFDHSTNK